MKILVTGGCGFIGSHLVDKLIELDHDVVVLDNLSSGKKKNMNPKATFVYGDIRDIEDVNRAMRNCNIVFHLAAITDARSDADDIYKVNYLGSSNVFRIAEKKKAKVIFTSSAAVYGNAIEKEDSYCEPISQYGKSKLKAEKLCPNDAFIIRLFNAYGPRGNSVINKFCKKMPKYDDITVFGNGLQTRDYIYISDVINALLLGLDNTGLYNVGTGVETSVMDIIEIIRITTRNKPHMKFTTPNKNEVKRSKADISKIKKLKWKPEMDIVYGIRELLS